jgi:hypothetical protein
MQAPDGLLYTPTTGRDWILPPNMDVASGSPGAGELPAQQFCLLGFGTARSLAAMCLFHQMDPNGPWKDAAHRLAHAYDRLMINKGENEGYLFSTWMYPGRPVEKPAVHPFDKYVYLAGTQAWIAQYLAMYDRALHDPAATRLAERMMNYNMFDREVNEPDGKFQAGPGVGTGPLEGQYAHFHAHATNILADIYVYIQTGNKALLERAVKSYEYGKSKGEPLIGFFPMVTYDKYIGAQTAETCQVADMAVAAVMLAKVGYDHCWDDADRWAATSLQRTSSPRRPGSPMVTLTTRGQRCPPTSSSPGNAQRTTSRNARWVLSAAGPRSMIGSLRKIGGEGTSRTSFTRS